MTLTPQQIDFYNVFGYLVLREVFSKNEMRAMSDDFDAVALADREGSEFGGVRRQSIDLQNTDSFGNLFCSDSLY